MNYLDLATQIVAGDTYKLSEKVEYWTKYWESERKSRKYFDLLVEAYQPMVRQIVVMNFKPPIDAFPDFIQEGNVGLIYSIQNFNPEYKSDRKKGKSKNNILFFTFAQVRIKGEIYHMLRDRFFPIRQPAWIQEIQSRLTRAENDSDKNKILDGCTKEAKESLITNFVPISIFQPTEDGELEERSIDFSSSKDVLNNVIGNLIFEDMFKRLNKKEKELLILYIQGEKLVEIAKHINTSPAEVSRLLCNIRKRIRPVFENYELIKEEKVILDSANLGLAVAM